MSTFEIARQRMSRRRVVRGGTLGTAGLLGAALIGCSGDDDTAPAATPAPGAPATGTPAAAAPSPDDEIKRGGVARGTFQTSGPAAFDLHMATPAQVAWTAGASYDGLVQFDPFEMDNVIPNLAHSWEFADEDSLVFQLENAEFHDGTQLTAEDVVVSFERLKESAQAGLLEAVSHAEAPDERTAVLRLHRQSAAIVPTLASPFMSIYSARDILDDGFDHAEQMNGTGPWIMDRYDRGARYVMRRNPNYYAEGDLPYLDGFEYHEIPEAVAKFAAFRTGEVDMFNPAAADVDIIERDMPDATVLSAASTIYWASVIATWREPWNDPRTWEAVALAINKQEANELLTDGRGTVGGPIPPHSRWELSQADLETIPGYSGDMEARRTEARALLDAAGVPEGTSVALFGRGDSTNFENWAVFWVDQLERVGLRPELTLTERATYDERLRTRDYGDMAAADRGHPFADPTPVFGNHYTSTAGLNYTGLEIPEVDDLFMRQDVALDVEERMELSREMQLTYLRTFPVETAPFLETRWAHHNYVHGYGVVYGSTRVSRKMQWVWLDT